VRQRNDTANALHVSAWPTDDEPDREPFDLQIGEETDFPQLLAGCVSLEPPETAAPEPDAEPAQDTPAAPKAKSRSKNADTADSAEGGEPR
jgi:hypothetical protein